MVASWKAPAVESAPVSVPASPDWPTHGSPVREVSAVGASGSSAGGQCQLILKAIQDKFLMKIEKKVYCLYNVCA